MAKSIGTRIPPDFRLRVSNRIRQVMKPHVKQAGAVYTECTEAARELNVTPLCVWYWYEGYHLPTLYNLVRFADLYGVSVDWLLGRTAVKELAGHLKVVQAA